MSSNLGRLSILLCVVGGFLVGYVLKALTPSPTAEATLLYLILAAAVALGSASTLHSRAILMRDREITQPAPSPLS